MANSDDLNAILNGTYRIKRDSDNDLNRILSGTYRLPSKNISPNHYGNDHDMYKYTARSSYVTDYERKRKRAQYIKKELDDLRYKGTNTPNIQNQITADSWKISDDNFNINKTDYSNNNKIVEKNTKSDEYKKKKNELRIANNEKNIAKFKMHKNKMENKDIGFGDKAFDTTLGGGLSLFDIFDVDNRIIDESGNVEQYLPSTNDMRHSMVQQSYDDDFMGALGKFINNVGYESSKIITSQALNATGAPIGSALYFGNIVTDSYMDAINEGFNKEESMVYGVSIGSLDYVLDKLTGGVVVGSNKILEKIGKEGAVKPLADIITDKLIKIGTNSNVSKIIGKAFAEGGQEFIEEFLEHINKLLFLNKSTKLSEYTGIFADPDIWSDALYAGAVGAIIGAGAGTIEGMSNIDMENSSLNVLDKRLEETKKKKSPKVKSDIEKIQNEIKALQEENSAEHNAEYYKNKLKRVDKAIENTPKEETANVKKLEKTKKLVEKEIVKQTLIEEATPVEEKPKVEEIKKEFDEYRETNDKQYEMLNEKDIHNRNSKALGMMESAEKRKAVQGDKLIPVEGGLTPIELGHKIDYLKSNHKGKEVIVDGKEGKIYGTSFGKIGVEFNDGTKRYVPADEITSKVDIDELIKKQYSDKDKKEEPVKKVEPKVEEKKVEEKKVEPKVEEKKVEEKTAKKIEEKSNFKPSDELNEKYNKLTAMEKKYIDKTIELREELRNVDGELEKKKIRKELESLSKEFLTKNMNDYLHAYTLEKFNFKKVSEETIKKQDKIAFEKEVAAVEEPKVEEKKVEEKPKVEEKKTLNDLYSLSKEKYEIYIQTGNNSFKKEALDYYNEYKKRNGKKKIEGLEDVKPIKNYNLAARKRDNVIVIKNIPEEGVSTFNERVKKTEQENFNESDFKKISRVVNYEIKTNSDLLEKSKNYLNKMGYEKALQSYELDYKTNEKVTPEEIAKGQQLLNYAIENHILKDIKNIAGTLSLQLTEAGQVVQAAKLFKYASKEKVILNITKTIEKLQTNKVKGAEDLQITDEMIEKINDVEEGDIVAMKEVCDEIDKELAKKLKGTMLDKLQTWRYFSMLSSPATHIRNMLSNTIMYNGLIKAKDLNGAVVEKIVKKYNPGIFENTVEKESGELDKLKLEKIDLLNKKATDDNYISNHKKVINEIKTLSGENRVEAIYEQKNLVAFNMDSLDSKLNKSIEKYDKLKSNLYKKDTPEIRNEMGNLSRNINSMQKSKHELNAINDKLTDLLPKGYSSKSLKPITKEVKKISKQYYNTHKDLLSQGSKYKSNQGIESMKSIFGTKIIDEKVIQEIKNKNIDKAKKMIKDNLLDGTDFTPNKAKKASKVIGNVLETMVQINYDLLEVEDDMSKSLIYQREFGKMLMANGIDEQISKIMSTDEYAESTSKDEYLANKIIEDNINLFDQANDYATDQALEGTFQQFNAISNWLNKANAMKNKGVIEKAVATGLDIILPFKTTPLNIGKTVYEYTPIGLVGNAITNLKKLKAGEISATKYIDTISKGLAGTELIALGYLLRNAGVLTGDDDDDYGINIGNKIVTVDWAAPSAAILFIGSRFADLMDELHNQNMSNEPFTIDDEISNILSVFKPIVDMTVIENMLTPMNNYKYGGEEGVLTGFIVNYFTQYMPTIGGSFNKFIDPIVRTTSPGKNSSFKLGDLLKNNFYYKMPFMSKKLEPRLDEWGNEEMRRGNAFVRAYDSFIAPYRVKPKDKKVVNNLSSLYESTQDDGIIPTKFNGNIRYKNTTYKTSSSEKTKYQKTFGKYANEMIDEVVNDNFYNNLSDENKSVVINKIYEYANYLAKKEYFDSHNIEFESSSSRYNVLESVGISVPRYLSIKQEINRLPKEERPLITDKQLKDAANSNIPLDIYLDFRMRTKNIKGDPDLLSNVEGKTIKNSKKYKYLEQISKTKGLTTEQKLLLTYLSGNSINNGDYRGISKYDARYIVYKYINSLDISVDNKKDLFKSAGYTILKNGKVKW